MFILVYTIHQISFFSIHRSISSPHSFTLYFSPSFRSFSLSCSDRSLSSFSTCHGSITPHSSALLCLTTLDRPLLTLQCPFEALRSVILVNCDLMSIDHKFTGWTFVLVACFSFLFKHLITDYSLLSCRCNVKDKMSFKF